MNPFPESTLRPTSRRLSGAAVIAVLVASIGLLSVSEIAQGSEFENVQQEPSQPGSFDMQGVSVWFKRKFTPEELQTYGADEFRIESHMCSCYDRPEPHYPYILVFFSTPKGDLVGRPDRRGLDTIITRLAVRHGERYCQVESEDECYGSFSRPCDFSDFRYGPQLEKYFPNCKSVDPDSDIELTPARYWLSLQR